MPQFALIYDSMGQFNIKIFTIIIHYAIFPKILIIAGSPRADSVKMAVVLKLKL